MNLEYLSKLKKEINSLGLTLTPGLTFEDGEMKKLFLSMQKLDESFITSEDFDNLRKHNVMLDSEYVDTIKKKIAVLLGKSENGNLQIIAQEIKGTEVKLFFETEDTSNEILFTLKLISKYFEIDLDLSSVEILNNPIYGFTLDIKQEKIINFKLYFETDEKRFFTPKLLASDILYPYSIMYSFKNNQKPKLYEYWAFRKDTTKELRKDFSKKIFGVDIPEINVNLFDYKEFQYSRDDKKINFYFFDNDDKISKAKNDE